jgi:hypothetical protein
LPIILSLKKNNNKIILDTVKKYFCNPETKFFFAEANIIPDSLDINNSCNIHNNKKIVENLISVSNKLGFENIQKVIYDPNYYFYFNGIKMFTLKFEIARKILTFDYQDYIDIIIAKKDINKNIILPEKYIFNIDNKIKNLIEDRRKSIIVNYIIGSYGEDYVEYVLNELNIDN